MECRAGEMDEALSRLAAAPVHPGLPGSSEVVFARASVRQEVGSPLKIGSTAAIVSILMGIVAAGVPAGAAEPSPSLALFGPSPPLAPSTLLAGSK
jgi:hypothetical protein